MNREEKLLRENPVYQFIIHRLSKNRDCRIIITGSGGSTGVGKTTYALQAADDISNIINYYFDVDNSFGFDDVHVDAWSYISYVDVLQAGSKRVSVWDEIETSFDNRRSMTERQVEASQRFYTQRRKNNVLFATAPSRHNLDLRVDQNFDIWVMCLNQGTATAFYLRENDFSGEINTFTFKNNDNTAFIINFPDITYSNNSELFQLKKRLDRMKDDVHNTDNNQNQNPNDENNDNYEQIENEKIEYRRQLVQHMYTSGEYTQSDIANMLDISQQTVSKDLRSSSSSS